MASDQLEYFFGSGMFPLAKESSEFSGTESAICCVTYALSVFVRKTIGPRSRNSSPCLPESALLALTADCLDVNFR
jgi:hypothetical protein